MNLKLKKTDLIAGKRIAYLTPATAEKLNLSIGEKVEISSNGTKILATLDLTNKLVKNSEIALSDFIQTKLKSSQVVSVFPALKPESIQFIMKKLQGRKLTKKEISLIISDLVSGALTEVEVAYFVSGVYQHGLSLEETINLTEAMAKSGKSLHWKSNKIVDKHSIGGVAGNRTTPIVVSICSSLGLIMPKTSSRAITSASGTADVMETITQVSLSPEKLKSVVKKTNACLAWGGSLDLAPADDLLIRVERALNLDPEAQLIASIMSKKLSVGSKYVLIDIPFGQGAKVSKSQAKKLKNKFIEVAKHFKLHIQVVLTPGNQPIGNGIGPVLEMIDVLNVLKQSPDKPTDLEEKSIFLAAKILEMTGKAKKGSGFALASNALRSGLALNKFNEIISAQGKKAFSPELGKFQYIVKAQRQGKIVEIDNKKINFLARLLGCPSDKRSGIYLNGHINDRVKKNQAVLTFYAESKKKLLQAKSFLKSSNPLEIKM